MMEIVNLILPLEATNVNNPSDSRSDSGVTAGVTWRNSRSVGRVRWSHRLSYNRSMLQYKVIKVPP